MQETLHLSAASTAPNNNSVMLLHGFSDFCQDMVFTTHWPVNHKHWIRATHATFVSASTSRSLAQLIAVLT